MSGVRIEENYTFGYGSAAVAMMSSRTAENHAGFFLEQLQPGMEVLDVGCGPGTVTIGFAEKVKPGKVIGIELELSQTREMAAAAKQRDLPLTFELANVYDLPYSTNNFDAVFMSALIGNVAQPLEAFLEVKRVLKPGGIVGVKEFDHSGNITYPLHDFQVRLNELYNRLRIENGHDPDSGRKLRGQLHDAGFERVEAKAVYQTLPLPETRGDLIMAEIVREEWGPQFVNKGWAEQEEVDGIVEQLESYEVGSKDFAALSWVEAIARKP